MLEPEEQQLHEQATCTSHKLASFPLLPNSSMQKKGVGCILWILKLIPEVMNGDCAVGWFAWIGGGYLQARPL